MKKILKIISSISLLFLIYFGYNTYPKLDLISGFSAKSIASGHFIDHRSQEMIENGDNDIDLIDLAKNQINDTAYYATASVYGLKERKAIYREGLGATLINDDFDILKPYKVPKRTKLNTNLPFPYGNLDQSVTVFENIDGVQLQKAVANAFDKNGIKKQHTRSVLVVYKDKIIAEKYDTGFDKNSKILGWSMTKSITATLFGILQKKNNLIFINPLLFQSGQTTNGQK